ncbi:MAG: hypothetical protein Q9177_001477 [Variospora cf. flavescens]
MRLVTHVTEFRCLECQEDFADEEALTQHLADKNSHSDAPQAPAQVSFRLPHQQPPRMLIKTSLEKLVKFPPQALTKASTEAPIQPAASNIKMFHDGWYRWNKCNNEFVHLDDAEQYLASLTHNPLIRLKCIASPACSANFTSLSALISHLKSGSCRAGRDRPKTQWLIDQDGQAKLMTLGAMVPTITSRAVTCQSIAAVSLTPSEKPTSQPEPFVHIASSTSSKRFSTSNTTKSIDSKPSHSSSNPSTASSSTQLTTTKPSVNEPGLIPSKQIGPSNPSKLAATELTVIEADPPPPNLMAPLAPTRPSVTKPASIPCPHCPPSSKPFPTINALHSHLPSHAHSNKLFNCPTDMKMLAIKGRGGTSSREALGKDFLATLKAVTGYMERSEVKREELEGAVDFVFEKLKELGFEVWRGGGGR